MMDEEAILKRIVKSYLFHKGEATARMITLHIEKVGYGLRKPIAPNSLSQKMKHWSAFGKSGSWFRVKSEVKKDNKTWWSLE